MTLKQIEKQAILEALKKYKGHVTLAAKELGIGRATMYRKIKLYGITR